MTPPKPRVRISREEAIKLLRLPSEGWCYMGDESSLEALRMAIRALKREQKAEKAKAKHRAGIAAYRKRLKAQEQKEAKQ